MRWSLSLSVAMFQSLGEYFVRTRSRSRKELYQVFSPTLLFAFDIRHAYQWFSGRRSGYKDGQPSAHQLQTSGPSAREKKKKTEPRLGPRDVEPEPSHWGDYDLSTRYRSGPVLYEYCRRLPDSVSLVGGGQETCEEAGEISTAIQTVGAI